jgi:Na+-transporting NADH:ubiquinone oxidoreductase subunit A
MSEYIKIKRGLNLKLIGEAAKTVLDLPVAEIFAIKPKDFVGLTQIISESWCQCRSRNSLFYDKTIKKFSFALQ